MIREKLAVSLVKIMSPEFIENYNYYRGQYSEVNKLKSDKRDLEEIIDVANQIIQDNNKKLLGIKINSKENALVVAYLERDFKDEYNIIVRYAFSSYPVYRLEFKYDKENLKFGIIDNKAYREELGYGTIGVEQLIRIAKKHNIRAIQGEITHTDWDHVDKLEHFYKKFGFEVCLDNERKHGFITWKNSDDLIVNSERDLLV